MADKIRIGICGAGSFGIARTKGLTNIGDVEVNLGWSRSAKTRAQFTQETGISTVEHWQDICTSPEVDALLVCTINAEHFAQAQAALEAGKHVLVETPLCLDYAHARELAELADRKGLILHHGAKQRYHPDHADHIAQIRRIGRLLFAIDHQPFDFGPGRLWYAEPELTGGARTFLPYFMLDWMEAFGEVSAAVGAESDQDGWQTASITLMFVEGGYVTVNHVLGLGVPALGMHQVVGSEGTIVGLPGASPTLIQGGSETILEQREVDLVVYECQAFINEIRGLRDHQAELDLDLRALQLVDQALDPH